MMPLKLDLELVGLRYRIMERSSSFGAEIGRPGKGLLSMTLLKVFFHDMAQLDQLYRKIN